jgi:hypothetical protein
MQKQIPSVTNTKKPENTMSKSFRKARKETTPATKTEKPEPVLYSVEKVKINRDVKFTGVKWATPVSTPTLVEPVSTPTLVESKNESRILYYDALYDEIDRYETLYDEIDRYENYYHMYRTSRVHEYRASKKAQLAKNEPTAEVEKPEPILYSVEKISINRKATAAKWPTPPPAPVLAPVVAPVLAAVEPKKEEKVIHNSPLHNEISRFESNYHNYRSAKNVSANDDTNSVSTDDSKKTEDTPTKPIDQVKINYTPNKSINVDAWKALPKFIKTTATA